MEDKEDLNLIDNIRGMLSAGQTYGLHDAVVAYCDGMQTARIARILAAVCGPSPEIHFEAIDAEVIGDGYVFCPSDGDKNIESEVGSHIKAETAVSIGRGVWYNPIAWNLYLEACELSEE